MPELIDKIEALGKLQTMYIQIECACGDGNLVAKGVRKAYKAIERMPTIEAEHMQKPVMSEADRKRCEEWCKDCEHIEMCKCYPFGGCDFRLLPKPEQPTVEAEPVRHGQMIEGRYPNENKCSECGQEFRDDIGFIIQDDDGVFHYPKRCPECECYWDGGAANG